MMAWLATALSVLSLALSVQAPAQAQPQPPAAINLGPAETPPSLLTVAERTAFRETARYDDVVTLLDTLAKVSPLAKRAELGKTFEGRSIPMLIIADPPLTAITGEGISDAELAGRVIVLAFGNIHAGEVDGKEALPILARQLLLEPSLPANRAILNKIVLLVVPIYNADGNEKVAPGNRGTQNGPEIVGVRENSQGFDLNRDFVKLEAPETRALVGAIARWNPAVTIDCHITNGSYHRYIVTYAGPKVPAGDQSIIGYARASFFPAIAADFADRTEYDSFWYGNFNGEWGPKAEPKQRWETFPAEARFGTNYIGLRNRLSVLVETYTYSPFEDRVRATVEFVRSTLTTTALRADEIRRLIASADRHAVSPERIGEPIAIQTREAPWQDKVTIKGFVETEAEGRRKPTAEHAEYTLELWDKFEAAKTVARPYGYAIPPGNEKTIETLRAHGLVVDPVDREMTFETEIYTIESAAPASRAFQGHVLVKAQATSRAERKTISAGWSLVKTTQTLGHLACYLLEPECEDGLTTWNFFDDAMKPGREFPVLRIMGPEL
jgi:dipeptidyl-peptidase-4